MQKNCIKHNALKTKINKLLDESSGRFLNQLIYWSTCRGDYGIYKDDKVWIYNTLDDWAEQLKVSKSSVRRAIKSLKEKKLITAEYLSKNKRNRTLYYAVDFDELNAYISNELCVQKSDAFEHINEHMAEHMYININKQINKSNKSNKSKKIIDKNFQQSDSDSIVDVNEVPAPVLQLQKPTIVQDMVEIWTRTFPKSPLLLTKEVARYLVAAFKRKFNSSLKEWEKYLKLIKTSEYVMKETFHFAIDWVIKFTNIDKFRAGWLGVSESRIPVEEREIEEKAMQHIDAISESERCKEIRRKIVKILSPRIYNMWFTHVKLVEVGEGVFMEADNAFIHDHIRWDFQDKIGLKFIEEATDHKDSEKQKILEITEETTSCVEKDAPKKLETEEVEKHEKSQQKKPKNFISKLFSPKLKFSAEEMAMKHIDAISESEKCKEIRRKIVKIISAEHYNLWFKYIELVENNGLVLMKEVDGVGGFVQEYISENLSSKIGLEFMVVAPPVVRAGRAVLAEQAFTASQPADTYASAICDTEEFESMKENAGGASTCREILGNITAVSRNNSPFFANNCGAL